MRTGYSIAYVNTWGSSPPPPPPPPPPPLRTAPTYTIWVHTSNRAWVVNTATNQSICHSKVGLSSIFLPLLLVPSFYIAVLYQYYVSEINFSYDVLIVVFAKAFFLVSVSLKSCSSWSQSWKEYEDRCRSTWWEHVLRAASSFWWMRPEEGYNFTVSLSRGSFCIQLFVLFYQVFIFFFGFWLCPFIKNKLQIDRRGLQLLYDTWSPWSHRMSLSPGWLNHRVISDKVHRLFVTLSYFRPDRFVHFLSLIPTLILLLHLLVSIDLTCTGICRLYIWNS